jgi:hypothetical protein
MIFLSFELTMSLSIFTNQKRGNGEGENRRGLKFTDSPFHGP